MSSGNNASSGPVEQELAVDALGGRRRPSCMSKLILEAPEEGGSAVTFPLIPTEVLIGRMDSADIVLPDPAVSRIHAKIVRETLGYVIVDLDSSSGTLINGDEIARHTLQDGDLIEIGSARIVYQHVSPSS